MFITITELAPLAIVCAVVLIGYEIADVFHWLMKRWCVINRTIAGHNRIRLFDAVELEAYTYARHGKWWTRHVVFGAYYRPRARGEEAGLRVFFCLPHMGDADSLRRGSHSAPASAWRTIGQRFQWPISLQPHYGWVIRRVVARGAWFSTWHPCVSDESSTSIYRTRLFLVLAHEDHQGHFWESLYLRLPGNHSVYLGWIC